MLSQKSAFAGAGVGLSVRGCRVCPNAGFVQMRGLSKCGVIEISRNILMRGGSLRARSNPSLNSKFSVASCKN